MLPRPRNLPSLSILLAAALLVAAASFVATALFVAPAFAQPSAQPTATTTTNALLPHDGTEVDAALLDSGATATLQTGENPENMGSRQDSGGAVDASDDATATFLFGDGWLPWPSQPLGDDTPSMGHATKPTVEPEQDAPPLKKVADGQGVLLRTLMGLLIVFALAWLAAHPAVLKAEKALGFEHVIGAGLPFVLLGLVLRSEWVGVLDDNVLHHLAPLFEFGLGWLGFLVGFRFNLRFLDALPRGMPTVIAVTTSVPFLVVFVACGALMLAFTAGTDAVVVVRDAIVIATASAMTAARTADNHTWCASNEHNHDVVSLTEQLDEIAAVIALLFLTAYFRPEGDTYTWQLPGTAWIFIALGMGAALGIVIHIMLRQKATSSEFLAITLGSVALSAGMADYLWLSPIVVCFIAGSIVANMPLAQSKDQLWRILAKVEWPLYLVFLTCVGAFWDIGDWRGWLLVPAFVVARLVGKWMSIGALSRADVDHEYNGLLAGRTVFARVSGLSIALVVSWESLYGGQSGRWIVTGVVGGAIVLELLAHGWDRGSQRWLRILRDIRGAAPPSTTGAFEPMDVSAELAALPPRSAEKPAKSRDTQP